MITKIELRNFRKYDFISLDTQSNLNILIGDNAVGKTTILEAIYLISTSKSHRTNNFLDLIKENTDFARVYISSNNKYEMIISGAGKKALINKIELKKTSEFIGKLKTVIFSPIDLNLVLGNKSDRRSFLDLELSLLDKSYLMSLNLSKKLIKERNELLKQFDDSKKLILEVITDQLIDVMIKIIEKREEFIKELNLFLVDIHPTINLNEKLEIVYLPSVTKSNIKEIFKQKLNYDILTKMTNYGIHRDDIGFMLNDLKAQNYASQGQIRGLVISLKIALKYLITKKTKIKPVLLLDDVFSELDDKRQINLISYLNGENQTFITTTNINNIPQKLLKNAMIINLNKEWI